MSEMLQGTLGEFVTQISGGGTPARDIAEYWTGKIPWISVKDLASSNPESTAERISEYGLSSSSSRLIPSGIPIVATRMAVGRAAVYSSDVAINQDLKAIFPNEELLHRKYLFHFLKANEETLASKGTGSTVKGIRLEDLEQLPICVPPLPEQKKIAEILSGIDNLIKTIDIKIAKLNIANTEVSRDIFSDFSPTEEEAVLPQDQSKSIKTLPLESVCEAVVDCKNRTPPYVDRGYPVIRTPNVRNGRLVIADLRYTDEESYQIWTARSVPRPMDILFTREAPLGEACLIPNGFRCCLGQRMMLFRANKSLLDPQYLLYAMMSPFVQEQLGKSKGGTTVGHARVTDIRKIKIPILPMEKQLQVGYLLASIKSCLQQTIEKKEKMRAKKNALASDLLSGLKRVSV